MVFAFNRDTTKTLTISNVEQGAHSVWYIISRGQSVTVIRSTFHHSPQKHVGHAAQKGAFIGSKLDVDSD